MDIVGNPVGDRSVDRLAGDRRLAAEAQLERAVGFAQEHDDFAGEDIGELAAGGVDEEIGAGEFAELRVMR